MLGLTLHITAQETKKVDSLEIGNGRITSYLAGKNKDVSVYVDQTWIMVYGYGFPRIRIETALHSSIIEMVCLPSVLKGVTWAWARRDSATQANERLYIFTGDDTHLSATWSPLGGAWSYAIVFGNAVDPISSSAFQDLIQFFQEAMKIIVGLPPGEHKY